MTETAALLRLCSFPPSGSDVTCAVSGGPDSLALLVLAVEAGCRVTAIHVDHGIRPGSADEADIVGSAAARFGARFRAERIDVEPGPNLEARLRAARYAVLPSDVLTGHTADDLGETMLLNLLRGAGSTGLAGMRSVRKPLLRLRRTQTERLCRDLGLDPVRDPTNLSPEFRRNRVRNELIPLANDIAQRDVVPLLARSADLLRDDDELLDALAAELDPTDARALARAPRPLATRAVRRWLAQFLGGYSPDRNCVDRVLEVATGAASGCEIGGGLSVRRSGQRLSVLTITPPTTR